MIVTWKGGMTLTLVFGRKLRGLHWRGYRPDEITWTEDEVEKAKVDGMTSEQIDRYIRDMDWVKQRPKLEPITR